MIKEKIGSLASLLLKSHAVEQGVVPKAFIRQFLPRNPVMIEAGAHIGNDTKELSRLWPEGFVYAFEPIPELFEQLLHKTRALRNVKCYPMALSDTCGTASMFVSDGRSDASSSMLQPRDHLVDHPDVNFRRSIEVKTTTIDSWATDNKVEKVDFLWLDLQGYELPVVKASPSILRTVTTIYTEVCLKEVYAEVALYPKVRQWLQDQGFDVVREELPWHDGGNVLFTRR